MTSNLLLGEAALAMGVTEHQIKKAIAKGIISVPKAGRFVIFPADDLPRLKEELTRAGYGPTIATPAGPVASAS